MFNIGAGEMALIAVVALLVLGPKRLPELARGLGKFMREFRRQTDEVRGVVEREFYRMDQDASEPSPTIVPAHGALPTTAREPAPEHPVEPDHALHEELPPVTEVTHSQAMMPPGRPVDPAPSQVEPAGALAAPSNNPRKPT